MNIIEVLLSPQAWLAAAGIFTLRICDVSLDTIRLIFVVRGRKKEAWILGFFTSLIFVVAISSVLAHLDNPLNVIGYAAGFATGNVVGMFIEEKLAIGHIQLRIISPSLGSALVDALREGGFAVTEVPARGKDGAVAMLLCGVLRRNVQKAENIIHDVDPMAFVTAEDVHPIRRGFWSSKK
jgi:uncharacterized protein YebE (UPF0316 family)